MAVTSARRSMVVVVACEEVVVDGGVAVVGVVDGAFVGAVAGVLPEVVHAPRPALTTTNAVSMALRMVTQTIRIMQTSSRGLEARFSRSGTLAL
jgi:hypothetical protein